MQQDEPLDHRQSEKDLANRPYRQGAIQRKGDTGDCQHAVRDDETRASGVGGVQMTKRGRAGRCEGGHQR